MEWLKEKQQVAKALGISRPALDAFLKLPGAPKKHPKKGWDLELVRNHVLKNTEKESIAANLDSDIKDLKKWDIYERARKAQIANDQKMGKLISVEKHRAEIASMAAECQLVLSSIPSRLAPEVVGLTVTEAERRLQFAVDEALTKLHNG